MASSTSLPQVKVDFGYTLSVTVDFEADLSSSKTETIPLPVPLEGKWTLNLSRQDDGGVKVRIEHGDVPEARFGAKVVRSLAIYWVQGGQPTKITRDTRGPMPFPRIDDVGSRYSSFYTTARVNSVTAAEKTSSGRFSVSTHRQYRVVCEIVSSCPELETLHRMDIAKRVADLHLEQLPSQLRLYFPEVGKDGAELWPPARSESTEACDLSFREITITQTSFSTYHALLVYLETGYIRFAPLRSASSPSNPSASSSRNEFLAEHFVKEPSLPLPVSPKSMYRLADLLRLPDTDPLAELCLRAFSDSLTHHGAALELFSDTSICLGKLRKVVLEYVVKNWEAVSASTSWKEKMAKIKAGEMPEAAGIMVELVEVREEVAMDKKNT